MGMHGASVKPFAIFPGDFYKGVRMDIVKLKKDGFFARKQNAEGIWEDSKVEFDVGFFQYWRSILEIEGAVTLADLINIINTDDIVFLEMLTQSSISEFIREMNEEVEDNDSQLVSIEVRKYYEANEYDDFSTINEAITCSGRYKEPRISEHDPSHTDERCAIEFCHWSTLKDLPLVLDLNATLTVDMDYKAAKTYESTITVGDFFTGLFDEICFFGSPERRDGEMEELNRRIKEVEDGTAELIPWEEVRDRLEEKLK